mmetsp:Transcript_60327/g.170009  ORF Transcript_60327/g.170009 Transcript_60327/m.170009 type:complete len:202 (+) Transcript_60327:101-706(+)
MRPSLCMLAAHWPQKCSLHCLHSTFTGADWHCPQSSALNGASADELEQDPPWSHLTGSNKFFLTTGSCTGSTALRSVASLRGVVFLGLAAALSTDGSRWRNRLGARLPHAGSALSQICCAAAWSTSVSMPQWGQIAAGLPPRIHRSCCAAQSRHSRWLHTRTREMSRGPVWQPAQVSSLGQPSPILQCEMNLASRLNQNSC